MKEIKAPHNAAEAVANSNSFYTIFRARMERGGHAGNIPKYKDFQRLFHALVSVCGDSMNYTQNSSNALAVITWLCVKYDREKMVLDRQGRDPVYRFAVDSICIFNFIFKDAAERNKRNVLFGPISKN